MAAHRHYWKGYLKLSLVNCSVVMNPTTSESEKVRFHTLSRRTGSRVVSRYDDSVTGKPVREDRQAKGYDAGDDGYIILSEHDLQSVELEAVRTINIEKFVPRKSIEWIYLETPFYLSAGDKIGQEPFAVIREAMKAEDVVGVSRIVVARRERAVVLEPRGQGIVLWTLRFADEVRPEDEYFGSITEAADEKATAALESLISSRTKKWTSDMVSDPIQEGLIKLIARKKMAYKSSRKQPLKAKPDDKRKRGNVIDIMDALKKSVQKELRQRRQD